MVMWSRAQASLLHGRNMGWVSMAGKKSRSDGRPDGAGGSRRRKTHVPPIIDLEAVIVEDADTASSREDATAAGATDPKEDAGAKSWPDEQPASWMEEMKTFFLGGVHIGRWRIPAAGSIIVLAIFVVGVVAGRFWLSGAPAGDVSGPAVEQIAALETVLKDAALSNTELGRRFDTLEEKLDAANANALKAKSAADAALSEVRAMDADVQALATARADETGDTSMGEALRQQIAELAARLEQLAQNAGTGEGTGIPLAFSERLDALSVALDTLQSSVQGLVQRQAAASDTANTSAEAIINAARTQIADSLNEVLSRFEERLVALERDVAETPAAGPAPAATAAAELHKAVDSGAAYQRELAALAAAMPGDPAVAAISAHAPHGVATRSGLLERFETVAAELSATGPGGDKNEEGDGNLLDDVWSRVNRLVDVRKSSDPGSRTLVGAVDAAREFVETGDIAGAADALAAGGDGLTEVATTWIEDARARAHIEEQMDGLLRRALLVAVNTKDRSGS